MIVRPYPPRQPAYVTVPAMGALTGVPGLATMSTPVCDRARQNERRAPNSELMVPRTGKSDRSAPSVARGGGGPRWWCGRVTLAFGLLCPIRLTGGLAAATYRSSLTVRVLGARAWAIEATRRSESEMPAL